MLCNRQKEESLSLSQCFLVGGGPGIMILIQPVLLLLFSRQRIDNTAVDGTALIFSAYTVLSFLVAICSMMEKTVKIYAKNILRQAPIYIFICYILYCLFASFWSVLPILSCYRAFECLSMLLLYVAALSKVSTSGSTVVVCSWCVWVISWINLVTLLHSAKTAGLNFNQLGYIGQMTSTIFFYVALTCKCNLFSRVCIIFFSLISSSTTASIGMALGGIFLLSKLRKYDWLLLFLPFVLVIIISYYGGIEELLKVTIFSNHSEILDSDTSSIMEHTSGRGNIWALGLDAFLSEPLLGYGFVAGEMHVAKDMSFGCGGLMAMHNGYLSSLIGSGLMGGFLFVSFMISVCIYPSYKLSKKYRNMVYACVTVVFFHVMANPGLGGRVAGAWQASALLVIMMCVISINERRSNNI